MILIYLGIIACAFVGFFFLLYCIWGALNIAGTSFADFWDVDKHPKYRDRWLVEHFGEAGKNRWLLNRAAYRLFGEKNTNKQLIKLIERNPCLKVIRKGDIWSCYFHPTPSGEVGESCYFSRGSNGETLGIVPGSFGGAGGFGQDKEYSWNPPWGTGDLPYHGHTAELFHGSNGDCHSEPRAADWFAAGFYDKGRRILIGDVARWRYYDMQSGRHKLTSPHELFLLGFQDRHNVTSAADINAAADLLIKEHGDPKEYCLAEFKAGREI